MEANFIDAYVFGPESDLTSASADLHRSLRRKCDLEEGDAISEVYRHEGPQEWGLPPHRCVSAVLGSNLEGADALQKFCMQLGKRLTRDTALTVVFVSAEWSDTEDVQALAISGTGTSAPGLAGALVLRHLRAKHGKTNEGLWAFMENDQMGPGVLDLLAQAPQFRAVFAHSLAATASVALGETLSPTEDPDRARPRL